MTPPNPPVPVPGSLCAKYVDDDYSLCCQMSDGSYRLLNVESLGVVTGSYNQEHGYVEFAFQPATVPLVPAEPKPSDFDPPISFIDSYTPGPSSSMETIDCTIIADDWTYGESDEYASYKVAIISGGVILTGSDALMPGDRSPMTVVYRDD